MSRAVVVAGARVLAQQEQQLARPRKLRRVAEAAAAGVEGLLELLRRVDASASSPGIAAGRSCRPRAIVASRVDDLGGGLQRRSARSSRQARAISVQHVAKPGRPHCDVRREIGAAVERLQVRRQPHAHRPAAGAGRRLHERHVDAIDVRPLLAIDLDRDEVLVQHLPRSRRSRTTRAPSRGTSGTSSSRSTGRSACPPSRAAANASSPHGYQSTGLCACCSRYGLCSAARRFMLR